MKRVKKEFITSSVAHYLRKRQFVDSADAQAKGKVWDCEAGTMSLRQVMDDCGSFSTCIAYSSTVGEPSAFESQYGRFKRFVNENTEPMRSELAATLYPLIIHTTLELVCSGHVQPAHKLLGRHQDQFKRPECKQVLESLKKVSSKQEVLENPELSQFREHRYCIQMSEITANNLTRFLKKGDNLLLVQMFNAHFDMKIQSPKPKRKPQNSGDESTEEDGQATVQTGSTLPSAPVVETVMSQEEGVSLAALKRCIEKVRQRPTCAPSVCLYTLCNTHQGLCTATMDSGQKQLCAGFEDSSIVIWSLAPKPIESQPSPVDISLVHLAGDMQEDIVYRHRCASARASGKESVRLRGHSGAVYSVCYTNDQDFLLSASEDTTVRIWNLSTFSNSACYRGHNYPVWDVHHSSVGSFFASCSADTTAKVWSTERVYPLRSLIGHTSHVNVVRYHPNGTYLATGSGDKTVRLWSTQEGSSVRLMQGHQLGVLALAFSPCGKLLASAGEDRVVRLWDLSTGQTVKELTGHPAAVHTVTFSEDGLLLASGSIDGTLKIWDLTKPKEDSFESSSGPQASSTTLASYSTKPASVLYLRFTHRSILTAAGAVTS